MAEDLRYPIGRLQPTSEPLDQTARSELLAQMRELPAELRKAAEGLSAQQLDTPYRPGGWTVRQVVHHLADAQMNWYIRTKLALTEDNPTIKPYDESMWAESQDSRTGEIGSSLSILDGLYSRWMKLLNSLDPSHWERTFLHPERGLMKVDDILTTMAWHGRHHTAHITKLRKRENW